MACQSTCSPYGWDCINKNDRVSTRDYKEPHEPIDILIILIIAMAGVAWALRWFGVLGNMA